MQVVSTGQRFGDEPMYSPRAPATPTSISARFTSTHVRARGRPLTFVLARVAMPFSGVPD